MRHYTRHPHLHSALQLSEPHLRRLQPVSAIVLISSLDDMESIYHPTLHTSILLALMQQIPMYQHQRTGLDLSEFIDLLPYLLVLL